MKGEIKKIMYKGKCLAIIIKDSFRKPGVNFVTPPEYSLQLGFHERRKGTIITPHVHDDIIKISKIWIQEVFVIKQGKVRFNLYSNDKIVGRAILNERDTIILTSGGHGVDFLEDTRMVEIRTGPYIKEKNKRFIPQNEGKNI